MHLVYPQILHNHCFLSTAVVQRDSDSDLCTYSGRRKIKPCIKWPFTGGQKQWKVFKTSHRRVAYKRWSLRIDSDYRTLTGKSLVFWRGSRLRQVVAHGVSTVLWFCTLVWNNRFRSFVGNLFIKHLFHSQPSFRGIEVVMTDVFFIKTSYYCLLPTVQRWCDPHFLGVNRA